MRDRFAGRLPASLRRRTIVVALCAVAFVLLTYSIGLGGLDSDMLLERRSMLAALAANHPLLAAGGYVVAYVLGMSLALPLGGVLGLLAGFLFGRWVGLALVILAGTISAAIVFAAMKRVIGANSPIPPASAAARLAGHMRAHGFLCVLAMRIIPAFPFFVVTLVAAVAAVRWRAFLLATLLGKVPASLIYTGLGETLGQAGSLDEIVTTESVVGLTVLGALALTPLAYRAWRSWRSRSEVPARSSPLDKRKASVSAS